MEWCSDTLAVITQALVANGARVYITGRRQETLQETVKQYNTGPGSLQSLVGDVSKKDECIRLAQEVEKKEPKGIQLLVNNAGIARDSNTMFCRSSHSPLPPQILICVQQRMERQTCLLLKRYRDTFCDRRRRIGVTHSKRT